MTTLDVTVAGVGVWSPRFAGWAALRRACVDAVEVDRSTPPSLRPSPLLLPAAERRRVPDGVAVALEVAREALVDAADDAGSPPIDVASLASVFASAHGELAIVDYLCATLADDPMLLSPTRFHHSVHNAAAGYWGIATPSVGPSTSIAAGVDSFVVGLVEAATQVVAEDRPVLLVAFDTPAAGLLVDAVANAELFGAALLLVPPHAGGRGPRLSIGFGGSPGVTTPPSKAIAALAASSPAAAAVRLLDAIARDVDATVAYRREAASPVSVNVRRHARSEPGPHDAVAA